MSEAMAPDPIVSGPGMTRALSDGRLVRRAAGGDERAFATIFGRYHQALYRYCLAIVGNPQDAQDALQNTMVKVLRALPGETRQIELKPWLYRIAHNESIELLRRRRDTDQIDVEPAAPGAGVAEEAASRERLGQLLRDIDELPERQRGALLMRELAGLDFAGIALALGTSPAVARQTLYEARQGLRQMEAGREMSCQLVTRSISDGDGRVLRRRDVRAHLRTCADCRRFREQIAARERDLGALAPLPAVAAAGLLSGLLGGSQGAAVGVGAVGALGGGTASTLGTSALLKGAATVAVVAAIGVGAADRGGLIDVGPSGKDSSTSNGSQQPAVVEERAVVPGVAPTAAHANQGSAASAGTAPAAAKKAAGTASAHQGGAATVPVVPSPVPASGGGESTAAHPHGRGHEKQHSSAATKGQQTAVTHKEADHGSSADDHAPAHPAHPPHPTSPSPSAAGAGKATGQPPADAAAQAAGQEGAPPPAGRGPETP